MCHDVSGVVEEKRVASSVSWSLKKRSPRLRTSAQQLLESAHFAQEAPGPPIYSRRASQYMRYAYLKVRERSLSARSRAQTTVRVEGSKKLALREVRERS